MKSLDLGHIRFVTRHFNGLQGLRHWVPFGLIILGLGGLAHPAGGPLAFLGVMSFPGALLLMLVAGRYYRSTLGEIEPVPAEKLEALSIFSPAAGPAPPIAGFPWVTPAVRCCFYTMVCTLVLFLILQAITPAAQIWGDEPWPTLDSVFISHSTWSMLPRPSIPPLLAQTVCILFGSSFFGIWLWRERHPSQMHYLVLAILLLVLAAFGACLGLFVWEAGDLARIIDAVLPAVALPWMALLLCGSLMVFVGFADHWQLVRLLGRSSEEGKEE